ncbi:NADPH-dependent FMN reductase [Sphingomonas nostoxanthinifaciens]|uniref:NADPH-dependent FMN reductase n=1 Tax=Sphingomonas nostoxanthinifaciens TaxID=2872652 RepID=UPI001CC1EEE1|nr:NAD(P)H-dependent oxidoreductase [Sphingomonas nostoxanthinifaciens]UAK26161.1 NAD(P)H-dependent oxidoreductase [Sphingomonas nostoxanthinifaciens]
MADPYSPLILGLGGTARPNSTSERAARAALAACEALGARIELIDGPTLARLPLYVPGETQRSDDEARLVAAARACDGIIVVSPGYHGSISGPIKNALDLLEDLARDGRPYLDGCAFGTIVTAYGWLACGTTLVTLRSIAHALRAWPTPYGVALNASQPLFDDENMCLDDKIARQIEIVADQVVSFARWRHAGAAPRD